jgi:hypothetical protein
MPAKDGDRAWLDRSLSRRHPPARRGERQRVWQRRYRARQREGRRVPDIGSDENSFLIETRWLAEGDAADWRAGDAPSRVRLLEINPEIAKQTTVLAT